MNIVFLTLGSFKNINDRGIYTDLLREFRDRGHNVYVVAPTERRAKKRTSLTVQDGVTILNVRTLNITKTNIVEKGLSTLLIEFLYKRAIKRYLKEVSLDLVLYSTPPITFSAVVGYIKKKYGAASYLLLKDIFPQNAVDLGMFRKNGVVYRLFRQKEKSLYSLSDYIGCMSPANVEYVLRHNPQIDSSKVELCPNSIKLIDGAQPDKETVLAELGVDTSKRVFIYGGNLGAPQGVDFLIEALSANTHREDVCFLIVGSGTEYGKIERWYGEQKPQNVRLINSLPKELYDSVVRVCDVGMIFLDRRFTIPNYPSRLLSYLEYGIPVLSVTDVNTDIGTISEREGYGVWSESGDLEHFNRNVDYLCSQADLQAMGERGRSFLRDNYTVERGYEIIMRHFEGNS